MQSLSTDLRLRIIRARKSEDSGAVAKRFAVSVRTVQRLWKQYEASGHVEPKRRGGYKRSRLERHQEELCRWIDEQSDITLVELQERLLGKGIAIGINALWQALDRWGLTFKKNAARRRAGQARRSGAT